MELYMNYIEVVHWEEFQHYKHRNPPWVKLHNQLLENYDYTCLPDCSKSHLLGIWMLASRTNNKIPANLPWIAGKIGATDPINIDILVNASFLRYVDDSGVLADCPKTPSTNVPLVEKSREEKSREETETSSSMNKFTERDLADAIAMFEKILLVAQKTKKPNLENWADQFRLMREQDKLTHDEIWSVFMFANNDPFWSVNILSPKTLRAKFSSLHAKMIGEKNATSKFTGQKVVSKSERRDEAARAYLEENDDDGVAWSASNEVSP
jgi:hypothetical protein